MYFVFLLDDDDDDDYNSMARPLSTVYLNIEFIV